MHACVTNGLTVTLCELGTKPIRGAPTDQSSHCLMSCFLSADFFFLDAKKLDVYFCTSLYHANFYHPLATELKTIGIPQKTVTH